MSNDVRHLRTLPMMVFNHPAIPLKSRVWLAYATLADRSGTAYLGLDRLCRIVGECDADGKVTEAHRHRVRIARRGLKRDGHLTWSRTDGVDRYTLKAIPVGEPALEVWNGIRPRDATWTVEDRGFGSGKPDPVGTPKAEALADPKGSPTAEAAKPEIDLSAYDPAMIAWMRAEGMLDEPQVQSEEAPPTSNRPEEPPTVADAPTSVLDDGIDLDDLLGEAGI
jgi:hypothetical protein